MKLAEALKIINAPQPTDGNRMNIDLACGFEPLHLKTFILAEARRNFPSHNVTIDVGLYGSLVETLRRLSQSSSTFVTVFLEWSDLDPRLGFRSSGPSAGSIQDILDSATNQARQILRLMTEISKVAKVILSPPSSPLPIHFQARRDEISDAESSLGLILMQMISETGKNNNIHVVNVHKPVRDQEEVFNLRMLLGAGFPYTTEWAYKLAHKVINQLSEQPSKKGIITDLDNTFWRGILGDDGVDGIHWSMDSGSQNHALYQHLLAALAEQGVLIGVVSKNDPDNVETAFACSDFILKKDAIFPIKASWGRKSLAVGEVLQDWNVLPDSVVFVDDSEMELEEVRNLFPDISTLKFPTSDDGNLGIFLSELRDCFEYRQPTDEDQLRTKSLKANAVFSDSVDRSSDDEYEQFLSDSQPEIEYEFNKQGSCERAFELINKVNQFNLNGQKLDAGGWSDLIQAPDTFLLTIAYKDKFGPLGTIAAIVGRQSEVGIEISSWVMSCRAFSRRIEYQSLSLIFNQFDQQNIMLNFHDSGRNGPFQDFLNTLPTNMSRSGICLGKPDFDKDCPRLYHKNGNT
jgi:FkbH-like protein